MKKRIGIALLSALAMVSCNKEETFVKVDEMVEIKATIYQEQTKVGFDSYGKFYWTVNDAIGVTTTSNKASFAKMTMDPADQGKASATFSARYMAGSPEGYAIYPYSNAHKMNGSVLTYTLPSSYDYTIEDHDYHVTDGSGNSFNPAMWSAISNGKVAFRHLGGILCVKVANLPAGQNQALTVTTSNRIAGEFTADLAADAPAFVTEASTENNSVTINYSNSEESTRVFYVPVPTGTYESIVVSFVVDGETIEVPFESKTINLRSAQRLQIGDATIVGSEAAVVENVEGANTALASGKTSVSIANVSSTDNALIIPEQSSNDAEISVEIVSVEANAVVNIEEEAGTTTPVSTLYLTVPEVAVENVVINMPSTTVYVNGKIASLTAATSENTLVVGQGTEIASLTVKAGNVRLQNGGYIGSIVAETAVYLILEEGAAAPATVGANVTVVSEAEYDLLQAIANAQPGETVTLTGDFTTSDIIVVDKAITLDGNGKTITSKAGRAINVATEGNVTIKNLNINCSGERAVNVITKPVNLTIANVTASAANYTVNVAGSGSYSIVNIANSDLTGLNVVNVAGVESVVTVTDTKLTCKDQNEIESYAALSLNKDALDASITATGCTFDIWGDSIKAKSSADGGSITIDGVVAGVESVAVIEYGDYYYSFATLADALQKANAGETIKLVRDITLTESLEILKSVNFDGNGKTITTDAQYAFVISDNATRLASTWTNVNIVASRTQNNGAVFLVGNAEVTLGAGVNIDATGYGCAVESSTNDSMTSPALVTVNGANISLVSDSAQGTVLGAGYKSTINVESGVIDGSQSLYAVSAYATGGTVNLNGGTITGALHEYAPNSGITADQIAINQNGAVIQ